MDDQWYTVTAAPPVPTLREWAEQNNLALEVVQRPTLRGAPTDYYATFKGVELKDGGCLVGAFGDGTTPQEAIAAYQKRIEGSVCVVDAFKETRRELYAPWKFSSETPAHG